MQKRSIDPHGQITPSTNQPTKKRAFGVLLLVETKRHNVSPHKLNEALLRNGGVITGTLVEEEMTQNELFEARLDDIDVKEARQEAAVLATVKHPAG